MSYIKNTIVLSIFCVLLFTNCEDKQSKEKPPQTTQKENTTPTVPSSQQSTPKETPEVAETHTIEPITNTNVRDYLMAYGKENPETKVRITTSFGTIDIELYNETPLHRANFIHLVKEKYFDETFFYRVAKDFLIQGGNSDRKASGTLRHQLGDYKIPQEQLPSLTHTRGAVAAAKQWVDNPSDGSNPFEFFIVVNGKVSHHLDHEHTIFGRVLQGMSVVDSISKVPVDESEWPLQNISMTVEVLP